MHIQSHRSSCTGPSQHSRGCPSTRGCALRLGMKVWAEPSMYLLMLCNDQAILHSSGRLTVERDRHHTLTPQPPPQRLRHPASEAPRHRLRHSHHAAPPPTGLRAPDSSLLHHLGHLTWPCPAWPLPRGLYGVDGKTARSGNGSRPRRFLGRGCTESTYDVTGVR